MNLYCDGNGVYHSTVLIFCISTDLGFAGTAECDAKGQTTPVSGGRIPQEGNRKIYRGRLGEILFFQ